MSDRKLPEPGWGLWWRWVMATMAGFVLSLYWVEIGFRAELGIWQGAIGGGMVGLAQWIVVRRWLTEAQWWAIASAVGWSLLGWSSLGVLGWVAPQDMDALPLRSLYGMVDGLQVGGLLGLMQCTALYPQIGQAWRWVVGSAVGWALGLAFGWAAGAVLRLKTGLFLGEVMGLGLGWLTIAAVTGLVLLNLLRQEGERATQR